MSNPTTPNAKCVMGLLIDPLDVQFFRDGRPFDKTSRGVSGLPLPQTLAGALRTYILKKQGCDFAVLTKETQDNKATFTEAINLACGSATDSTWIAKAVIRGPWLVLMPQHNQNPGNQPDVLVPAPANLMENKDDKSIFRLDPLPADESLPGWKMDEDGLRAVWARTTATGKRASGFLSTAGLKTYLLGKPPEASHLIKEADLFGKDLRTGIGVSSDTNAAKDGMIYSIEYLSLKKDVAWYAEVVFPEDAPVDLFSKQFTVPWGGEGRRVQIKLTEKHEWPTVNDSQSDENLFLLTTPAFLSNGRMPDTLSQQGVISLVTAGSVAVSGWDLARGGPKPTRFATAAGSVFFVNHNSLTIESLTDNPEDSLLGWGCFAKGVWNHA